MKSQLTVYALWVSKLFFLIVILGATTISSQDFQFNYLDNTKGLHNSSVNRMVQGSNGMLYLAGKDGLEIYDSHSFTNLTTADGLFENSITTLLSLPDGRIICGHNIGGFSIVEGKKVISATNLEGISEAIIDIEVVEEDIILLLVENYGIVEILKDGSTNYFPKLSSEDGYVDLLIYNNEQIILLTENSSLVFVRSEYEGDIDYSLQVSENHSGNIWVKGFHHLGNYHFAIKKNGAFYRLQDPDENIKFHNIPSFGLPKNVEIIQAKSSGSYIWLITNKNGVLRCDYTDGFLKVIESYNNSNGLLTDKVTDCLVDREGVIWISTKGDGIRFRSDNSIVTFASKKNGLSFFDDIIVDGKYLWQLNKGSLTKRNLSNFEVVANYGEQSILSNLLLNELVQTQAGDLLISANYDGVLIFDRSTEVFSRLNYAEDSLSLIVNDLEYLSESNVLLIGTNSGLYEVNLSTNSVRHYDNSMGLASEVVTGVSAFDGYYYCAHDKFLTSEIYDGEVNTILLDSSFINIKLNSIQTVGYRKFYVATEGLGVYHYNSGEINRLNSEDGLVSDYCNDVFADAHNNIWVVHQEGLSKIDLSNYRVKVYNEKQGLIHDFTKNGYFVKDNLIWFGTKNGLVQYNSQQDIANKVAPYTTIDEVYINKEKQELKKSYDLPYGDYAFSFKVNGVSFKKRDELYYYGKLEGRDKNWSKLKGENVFRYTLLEEGDYKFKIKSVNADGIEGNVEVIEIHVETPYWKKWWFYGIIIISLALIYLILIKWRERNLLKRQKSLEAELEARTATIVAKNIEIETINKDLTDSILYARRIQSSILPNSEVLDFIFPNHFIFFQPRDVVSGDFYWCTEENGKKIMVCADCTGHGVPGGFMSMISHILLREAVNEKSMEDPASILAEIDKKIVKVLRQSDDFESNKDGLDASIIVYDEQSKKLKYAGAIRPLLIFRNGESSLIKGSRYSLGGIYKKKEFNTIELDIEPGDMVYMFTDGYSDQFGGSPPRKMKIKALIDYITQIQKLPIYQQKRLIEENFTEWMGDIDQLDDVLVIGIKF